MSLCRYNNPTSVLSTLQRHLSRLAFCFALLSGYTDTMGQAMDVRFKRIGLSEGLSNSTIEAIYQDSMGFMWFGTRDGLNRYDGYEMVIFKNNEGGKNNISNNYITCITEDAQHNLYIGTIDGLNKLNRQTNSFTIYKHEQKNPGSLAGNNIKCIYTDKRGTLWVGTDSGGLSRYNKKQDNFTRFLTAKDKGSSGNIVNCIYEDAKKNFWIGTQNGLKLFNRKSLQCLPVTGRFNNLAVKIQAPVNSIQQDTKGRLWMGMENGGILVYDQATGNLTPYKHHFQNERSISNDQVKCLLADSRGQMWAGVINGGLELFDDTKNGFIHHQNQPENVESLSQRTVSAIFEDRQGNLWVGTHRGGLNIYVPEANKFKSVHATPGHNTLSYNDVRAFYEDEAGNIWIGTDGGGLNAYHPQKKTFKHYRYHALDPHSLANDAVLDIMQDTHKTIWISTWGGGLNKFDRHRGTFQRYVNNPADSQSLSSNYVQKAYCDSKGNFWVATYYGGLNLFNPKTGQFKRFTIAPDGRTALKGNNIISLKEDGQQNLWIGTDDGGLNCYNLEKKQFKHYFLDGDRPPDLRVLFIDHSGRLWLGQRGLFLFDRRADKFKPFTTLGGLGTEFIKGIEEDKNGNLWVSTSTGITSFNPTTKAIKKYNIADGLQGHEFEANASLTTRDGMMYFGGINGFNVFSPDHIKSNTYIPPVYITALQLFNNRVLPGGPDNILDRDINFIKELKLTYRQSAISFQFAALNYNAPENNRYMYKMEGLDDRWYEASVDRKASFTNLSPGHYTFYVKGSNNDGIWNSRSKIIKIVITPPYWATWWFRTLIISLVMYIVYVALKFKKNLDLKKIEENKKEEMHQMKLQFFTNISHDLRTPLSLIIGPLENLLRDSPGEYFTNCYELMHRNATRLMLLINELMDFRKVESGAFSLKVSEGNIALFLENLIADFRDAAEQKAITLRFELQTIDQDVWFDRQILEKIILNLANNAIKFTQTGGNILVKFTERLDLTKVGYKNELVIKNTYRAKRYYFISIADNGIGISQDSLGHLFERYYRISESHQGSGIGLALVKSLTMLHKGDIYVYSEQHQGTEIILALPFNEHDYTDSEKRQGNDLKPAIGLESSVSKQLSEPVIKLINPRQTSRDIDKKYRILIVDDNDELRHFLRSCLEHEYFISEAANGAEGIAMTKEQHPDLIISDVMMPDTDGNEFCKSVRMDIETSHIPFIMLTAKTNLQSEIEGIESGADLYLAKPVSPKLLETSLRKLFEQRQKLKERYSKNYDTSILELVHNDRDKEFINNLVGTIEKKMSNPDLDVDMLCKEVGMSRTKLYHKIKQISGQSPNEFIRSTRLKKAATILTSEDVALMEVMYRVGIQTQSYFTKAFKKEFGETPSEFLQNHVKPLRR